MKYFKLKDSLQTKAAWYLSDPCDELTGEELIPYEFMRGDILPGEIRLRVNIVKNGPKNDISFTTMGVPIINERVASLIRDYFPLHECMQMIPVTVFNMKDKYYALNTLKCISCLSPDSTIDCWPNDGSAKAGRLLVVREIVMANLRSYPILFRVKEWCHDIIVSENFAQNLISNNISGVDYIPISVSKSNAVYVPIR